MVPSQQPLNKQGTPSTVSFQSPHHHTHFKPPGRYTPQPRPLSRTSSSLTLDSSEDPYEQFLAKSIQFAIPFSELGRSPASKDPDPGRTSNRATSAYPSSARLVQKAEY